MTQLTTSQPETLPAVNAAAPDTSIAPALELVVRLCQALEDEEILYCHWKSNNALDRSANGDNDLDLLVGRADANRFLALLGRLGFRPVRAPADKQMAGVLDYFGFDEGSGRLVHVHAHFQLAMGHDMTKNIRLAIETPYLASAWRKGIFRVPAAEFEYVVLVLRMMLKHSSWDAMLSREGRLKASEQRELSDLQAESDSSRLESLLAAHLPFISPAFFADCVKALQPGCPAFFRAKAARKLQGLLQSNAMYPAAVDAFLKLWRRGVLMVRRRLFKTSSRYTPAIGGAMIAILGGDGAGKTTALKGLHGWLQKTFETRRIHMGKPAWSPLTVMVRALLKVGQMLGLYPLEASFEATLTQKSRVSPGYPYLIREVLRARDRFTTYVQARRFAARGGLVLLDRFPMAQIELMDGMQAERFIQEINAGPRRGQFLCPRPDSRFARFLVRLEESYYHRIMQPDLLVVLRVHPDIAVQRKTDEEPASVHRRSSEIWALNWQDSGAFVIDSSQPRERVLAQLKALTWQRV